MIHFLIILSALAQNPTHTSEDCPISVHATLGEESLPGATITLGPQGNEGVLTQSITNSNGDATLIAPQPGRVYQIEGSFPGLIGSSVQVSCSPADRDQTTTIEFNDWESISLVSLLCRPENFESRYVQVRGFLQVFPEDHLFHPRCGVLYLTRDDLRFENDSNAVLVRIPETLEFDRTDDRDSRFVEVLGRFTAGPVRYDLMTLDYAGSIGDILGIERLKDSGN